MSNVRLGRFRNASIHDLLSGGRQARAAAGGALPLVTERISDALGSGGTMLRNVLRRQFLAALVAVAWSSNGVSTPARAQDIEKSSVIPIARSAPMADARRMTVKTIQTGDSSRPVRDAAVKQLPWSRLSGAQHAQARQVTNSISLFRRLPTLEIEADRRCYEFFASHPDVAVSIWRAMDISRVQMWQTGPDEYEIDTKDGSIGTVTVLHRSPESYLVICQGQFQSPALPKPIAANAMMHLQPRFSADGRVTHTVDLFVSFPSTTVETVAKLIAPVSYKIADRNLEEISLFTRMMSIGMSEHPGWVQQMAGRLDGVIAGRPEELLLVTADVYSSAEKARRAAHAAAQAEVQTLAAEPVIPVHK